MSQDFSFPQLESKKAKYQARYAPNRGQGQRLSRRLDGGFRCAHCQAFVVADSRLSGVQNRNHCPYCLWSRHLDFYEAGDRLAACKARMQPIGLTLKQARKKYAWAQPGELMIIHLCTDCGKVSINRIAADDAVDMVLEVFELSCSLDEQSTSWLAGVGVIALQASHLQVVHAVLFGQYPRVMDEMEYEEAALQIGAIFTLCGN